MAQGAELWKVGLAAIGLAGLSATVGAEVGQAEKLAPDVYFYQGDIDKGYCNVGWIVLEDYVLVIDASFPSGARGVMAEIRKITDKPIRFAFDTHHHGDHTYGNQVWVDQGATAVAHTGVIEELKRYETGYYGNKPGRWEATAEEREDVRQSELKPPSLLFPDTMVFDDGTHRVELHYFGTAHTHGDGFAWLPKEKILFTGDAVVNGPHNYVGDGDITEWIGTLGSVLQLGALAALFSGAPPDGEIRERGKRSGRSSKCHRRDAGADAAKRCGQALRRRQLSRSGGQSL
jgi:glyoxylase-like metal-dependent hydrolase (beta-lactamase superfamily II)